MEDLVALTVKCRATAKASIVRGGQESRKMKAQLETDAE